MVIFLGGGSEGWIIDGAIGAITGLIIGALFGSTGAFLTNLIDSLINRSRTPTLTEPPPSSEAEHTPVHTQYPLGHPVPGRVETERDRERYRLEQATGYHGRDETKDEERERRYRETHNLPSGFSDAQFKEAAKAVNAYASWKESPIAVAAALGGFGPGLGANPAAALAQYWSFLAIERAAGHPPRNDFDVVSKFVPTVVNLRPPADLLEATWQDFAKKNMHLAAALDALVVSWERSDGLRAEVEAVGQSNPTMMTNLKRYGIAQFEAVRHNAASCAQLVEDLLALRLRVNLAWLQLRKQLLAGGVTPAWSTPAELAVNFRSFQEGFRLSSSDVTKLMQATDQITEQLRQRSAPSDLPDFLLDEQWNERMQALSTELHAMSRRYDDLKTFFEGMQPQQEPAVYSASTSGARRCSKCGSIAGAGDSFCERCGAPVY